MMIKAIEKSDPWQKPAEHLMSGLSGYVIADAITSTALINTFGVSAMATTTKGLAIASMCTLPFPLLPIVTVALAALPFYLFKNEMPFSLKGAFWGAAIGVAVPLAFSPLGFGPNPF